MKKIIFLLLIATIGFTSCTNDEIEISYNTTFKVNPSTVIKPFTFEFNAGELEGFSSNYKLRLRLLIYNSDGILVQEATDYFGNYATLMNATLPLSPGKYTAIATSDIVKMSSNKISLEYWTLHDYKNLSTTRLNDAGYIGQNTILGISKKEFTVSGQNDNIKIDVQPAGALAYVNYRGVYNYSDVLSYELSCTKVSEGCIFDEEGNYTTIEESNNNQYDWRISTIDVEDATSKNMYQITYILPTNNLNLKFRAWTEDKEYVAISNAMTINPKAGEEYLFIMDIENIECTYGIVNGSNDSAPIIDKEDCRATPTSTSGTIYLKNINQ